MKNILAENMLRFGVKNLKESDVKQISKLQEQTGIQPYAAINPKSWKIKDDASWNQVLTPSSYPVKLDPNAAAKGVYGGWAQIPAQKGGTNPTMNPNAVELAKHIAEALASIMNAHGKYNPLQYKDFKYVIESSDRVSSLLKNKVSPDSYTPLQTIGNDKYALRMEPNQRGQMTTQAQWEATLAIIAPAITAVIQKYVLPAQQAPTPQAAAPGTPATPAKKI